MDASRFDRVTRALAPTSRRRALAVALALPLAPVHQARAAKVRRDASCLEDFDIGMGGAQRWAQTFVAKRSGRLVRAGISISETADGQDFVLQLRRLNDAGEPGKVLASVAFEVAAIVGGNPEMVRAVFPNPARVAAGKRYALVITDSAGQGFSVSARQGDPCPGKVFVDPTASGDFIHQPDADLIYETFVRVGT